MTRVTAMGCAGTALVAALAALHGSAIEAAAAALLITGVAGEIAAHGANGPGTFQPVFLDALFHLDLPTLVTCGRVS
jgi:hydroxyethylthiazole kinase